VRVAPGEAVTGLPLRLERIGGGELALDASGLARVFFRIDPSSVGVGAYDSLSGKGARDRIEVADIQALNRTMRARTAHHRWEPLLDRDLDWLRAIDPKLDLIETSDGEWGDIDGDRLVRTAIRETIGPWRGVSVATKLLHLKRPKLFPVLDGLVAELLGQPITREDAEGRADQAARLVLHIRTQGRRNRDALLAVQAALGAEGCERSLVRILDAALWLSHPAAGGPQSRRRFSVEMLD
jgi:hypothetical protein